ncbi:peptidoglycan-binding protein [Myxococcus sp. CA051A]|nr:MULTISPECIES: peptidoglycan-binding domain-containing protein [Myxococcus]NTX06002.1 peptidoglycan-binding protein [Myxococcus sp. CA040A]NTX10615.1 peptidoglycan-binding protein [Myxococcus sp. CA056]NTX38249.1 peptidoglycan-binding protein [Myxococcus sp. CA033]NTX55126.1 peptidoglycan-binding protein [Myxococcus sp. CA039A]NTX63398.1 peptidoglycan-binding protein [Myxococcus sp. CA051A]
MSTTHVIRRGECMLLVARRYGILDYRQVYEHPANAELRRKRPNPSVLYPGDTVFIPEPRPSLMPLCEGLPRSLTVNASARYLRLELRDDVGAPLASRPYLLLFGPRVVEGETDGNGLLVQRVPLSASRAELECEDQWWELELGTLRPMHDVPDDGVAGAEARLINLGYALAPTGRMTLELRSALRAFQHRNGLAVTGRLDAETSTRLEALHGS